MNNLSLRRAGFEPATFGSVDRCPETVSNAASTAYESDENPLTDLLTDYSRKLTDSDPDLAAVVNAWPELPDAIRAGIIAMVSATRKGTE